MSPKPAPSKRLSLPLSTWHQLNAMARFLRMRPGEAAVDTITLRSFLMERDHPEYAEMLQEERQNDDDAVVVVAGGDGSNGGQF